MLMLPAFVGTPELNKVHNVDAMTLLKALPDNYVNCIVTSPPYWNLRDYGVAGQIGLEDTPQQFIARLVELFREARRILRHDGTMWVNMGDSYAANRGYQVPDTLYKTVGNHMGSKAPDGIKPKNMLMMPARLAIALQDDGWILRSEIVWHKPNPMPESVADRPTKSHEMVYLLAKSERYFYDAEAIREKAKDWGSRDRSAGKYTSGDVPISGGKHHGLTNGDFSEAGRNKRSVWTVNTEPTPFAHFATFPQKLIEPMILAGCPSTVCACCGAPHVRQVENDYVEMGAISSNEKGHHPLQGNNFVTRKHGRALKQVTTLGFQSTCTCNAQTRAGIVLDPFMGSGTSALVARRLNRQYIGSELNIEYAEIARRRLSEAYTPMMQLFMETA